MPRILVVDDEETIRDLVVQVLEAYEVATAGDGLEAFEMLGERQFDLVLTDRTMPRMTGVQLLKKARLADIRIPFVLVSSHGTEAEAEEYLAMGFSDMLCKPFSIEDLLTTVERHVGASTQGGADEGYCSAPSSS